MGFLKQLGIPRGEAQQYMDVYYERYPGVMQYMEDTRSQATDQGYVETLLGRRLHLPEIQSAMEYAVKGLNERLLMPQCKGLLLILLKRRC